MNWWDRLAAAADRVVPPDSVRGGNPEALPANLWQLGTTPPGQLGDFRWDNARTYGDVARANGMSGWRAGAAQGAMMALEPGPPGPAQLAPLLADLPPAMLRALGRMTNLVDDGGLPIPAMHGTSSTFDRPRGSPQGMMGPGHYGSMGDSRSPEALQAAGDSVGSYSGSNRSLSDSGVVPQTRAEYRMGQYAEAFQPVPAEEFTAILGRFRDRIMRMYGPDGLRVLDSPTTPFSHLAARAASGEAADAESLVRSLNKSLDHVLMQVDHPSFQNAGLRGGILRQSTGWSGLVDEKGMGVRYVTSFLEDDVVNVNDLPGAVRYASENLSREDATRLLNELAALFGAGGTP